LPRLRRAVERHGASDSAAVVSILNMYVAVYKCWRVPIAHRGRSGVRCPCVFDGLFPVVGQCFLWIAHVGRREPGRATDRRADV
jgi:hypothetical protein